MHVTTNDTYDADLTTATEQLDTIVSRDGFPPREREKAMTDALNDTWGNGITIAVWVARAARAIAGER